MNDMNSNMIEPVTKTDILQLFSWDRERTNDELKGFISRRASAISDYEDPELDNV